MKRLSKAILLLLCLCMICSMFAGCKDSGLEYADIEVASADELDPAKIGDYGTLKLPLDKKGTTINIFCGTDVTTNNDSVVIKELRRRTGINVQVIAVPLAFFRKMDYNIVESIKGANLWQTQKTFARSACPRWHIWATA